MYEETPKSPKGVHSTFPQVGFIFYPWVNPHFRDAEL